MDDHAWADYPARFQWTAPVTTTAGPRPADGPGRVVTGTVDSARPNPPSPPDQGGGPSARYGA